MKFLIQPLSFLGFFLHTAREHPYELDMRQELCRKNSYDCISRNGNQHSDYSSDISSHEQDYEDFQRVGLDTVGVYDWLEDVIVYELCENEYSCQDGDVSPEANVYSHRVHGVVFEYQSEKSAYYSSGEWPDIWYYVQKSCHECNADRHAESKACHEMQSDGVYDCYSDYFYYKSYEIAAQQPVHVVYRFARLVCVLVIHERQRRSPPFLNFSNSLFRDCRLIPSS